MDNITIYYSINNALSEMILNEQGKDLVEIPYLYAGNKKHALYGEIKITNAEFDTIVKNFGEGVSVIFDEEGKPYLNINYNHSGNETDPEKIKSAGRIYGFKRAGDKLNALAWFTDAAKGYIKRKELNHISAEFAREWEDENGAKHKWVGRGAALTPRPFLKENQLAIAMADDFFVLCTQTKEKHTMELKEQDIKDLGLTEGKEIDGLKAIKTKADQVDGLTVKLTEAETKVKALEAQVADLAKKGLPEGMVAMKEEDVKFLKDGATEAIKLRAEQKQKDNIALVESAIKQGKIVPAQKDFALKLAAIDQAGFEAFLKDAKPVIEFKETGSGGDGEDKTGKADVKLTEAIDKLAAEKKISFTEARNILQKTNPEYFEDYKKG